MAIRNTCILGKITVDVSMKSIRVIFIFITIIMLSNCNRQISGKYSARIYPFFNWSNPDSIFLSYDTLIGKKTDNCTLLIRIWIDQSSSIKQLIEVKDTINGYKANRIVFGQVFDEKGNTKKVLNKDAITPKSKWNSIISEINSINLMDYCSRYHSWQTEGGPMNSPMIWYKVEYRNGNQCNNFVFWRFANHKLPKEMAKYEIIINLIDREFTPTMSIK